MLKNKMRIKSLFSFYMLSLLVGISGCRQARPLEEITPEEAGFSSEKLLEVSEYADKIGTGAITALYDGKLFYSWGNTSSNYPCHSIRKPLLGALYGIYSGKKILNLNQTLRETEIDDIPPSLTYTETTASIRDLLMSRSGVYHEAAAESEKMINMRPERGSHPPGTFFYYNNWDFNVLGTVFEKITGEKIFRSFKREIADPLGMEDFYIYNCSYYYEKEKSIHPAYFFKISSRDLARFGLLYMNYGKWNGKQIVPSEWIRESTVSYSENSMNGDGYGYLWSIIPGTDLHGQGFYHTGFNNHFLGILPEEKLVVVHRGEGKKGMAQDAGEMRTLLYMIFSASVY